ncbi:hypothetical protein PVBG_05949 [Plasmodium vivax Brazil I]|uniref:VIR protein n=1 Tax=Plasmodium vivax (strain Brazil I) TaxID=1033975 RepID=A0A0J9SN75_PLAV1|nr:hypothetical protein PVBG_05949 [Plasmodium vivax Brazil I]
MILEKMNMDGMGYNDFCMKLMRNLGYFSVEHQFYAPTSSRCNILYSWLYNSSEERRITDNIINKCFEEYTSYMKEIENNQICTYYSEDKIYEPMKIALLDIFQDNMQNIKDKLIREFDSTKLPFRKFVCKCIKIYKNMNELYCLIGDKSSEKHKNTCLKLDNFKGSYQYFLTILGDLYPNIPLLNDRGSDLSEKCPPDEQDTLLTIDGVETPDTSLESRLSARAGDRDRELTDGLHETNEMVDNSMKKNITTTIAKRLIHSGLGGSRRRIDSNFYEEGPNELLFDAFKGEDMSSHNARYNIGYGTEGIYE